MRRDFRTNKSITREYIEVVVVTIVAALVLRIFVISVYAVHNNSMSPTLKSGDSVFVYRLPFSVHLPFFNQTNLAAKVLRRGDVVVFRVDGHDFIKRVLGFAGDRVEIKNGHLFVNDSLLQAYSMPTIEAFGPILVPPGKLFLLGDNLAREHNYQTVSASRIQGRVFLTWISLAPGQSSSAWPHLRWGRTLRMVRSVH